ncbi:MAG: zinc ribbon domain-containing protein [Acidobacteria bacterium]|nr:zinc ribbon domain-containing protein [Acidobacteriota bacterium]MCW5970947.1 zinc ribbon domain-containing protein [Blastocatellales bacterium]
MTTFCAQCGNPLRSGGRFCQSCGTPAQPSAPAQQQDYSGYQSNVPPQSAYGSPATYTSGAQYAPPPRSTNWLKIVLITLAVIVVLAGVSIIGAFYVVKRSVESIVSVQEGEGGQSEVSINVPGGGVRVAAGSNVTEEQLGVPIYPGSVPGKDSGSLSIQGRGATGRGWFGVATFTTDDDMDDVVDFYTARLGNDGPTLDSRQDGKRTVVFNAKTEQGGRIVTIQEEEPGATKITIVSMQGAVVR